MKNFRSLGVSSALLVALVLCACAVQAEPSVKITSPKPKAVLQGTVPVLATADGLVTYSYATLLVDTVGKSLTNADPVRFELDTKRLKNGTHSLQIAISDSSGVVAISPAVPVVVLNSVLDDQQTPRPMTQPSAPAHTPITTAPNTTTTHPAPARVASSVTSPLTAPVTIAPPVIPGKSFASGTVTTILLDGKPLVSEYAPIIENGRAMIFLRPLIVAIGGKLGWDNAAKQATVTLDQRSMTFTVGKKTASLDGKLITIDRPAIALHGRLAVPVSIWRDFFGGNAGYNAEYSCIWLRTHASLVQAKLAK